jgi:hypothetical protein
MGEKNTPQLMDMTGKDCRYDGETNPLAKKEIL